MRSGSSDSRTIVARAPVRVSFGGGGTDLEAYYARFGGFVVSAAIARYCYAIARPAPDARVQITSADYGAWQASEPGAIPVVEEPLALPKAVVAHFAEAGLPRHGIDLFLASEVPPGTGLGSSSAMTVALVQAVAGYLGEPLAPAAIAELACRIEIEQLGMPIGRQDQYAAAFGGLNALAFSADRTEVTPLPLAPPVLAELDRRLLLFSTGTRRDSATILRGQRDDSGAGGDVTAALHRLKDLAYELRDALLVGDLDAFGRLLDCGWQEKKRLSGGITNADIDTWYATARAAGALGGKIAGAGGGGFLLLYCPPERQETLRASMQRSGLTELPFTFSPTGAEIVSGALPLGLEASSANRV